MRLNGIKIESIYLCLSLWVLFALCPSALKAAEGDKKWEISLGNAIHSSPAIGPDGTIYVGSSDGNLYAVNTNGAKKWSFKTQDEIYSSPAVGYDGTLYFGSNDNTLYAVNPDGTQKWAFTEATDDIRSSPAISSNGTIYVGCNNGKLYAVKSDGTSELSNWPFSADGAITASPAIASDGTIYVGSEGGKLYAVKSTGKLKWEFSNNNTMGSIHSSPAIDADGTLYFGSDDFKIYAVNSDGTLKWVSETDQKVLSSPSIRTDGSILVGSDNGNLYALSKDDGSQVWVFLRNDKAIQSAPLVASDGTLYFGSNDQNLYALNSSGSEKWAFYAEGKASASPSMGFGGDIYIGTEAGKLFAVETGSDRLASSAWPAFHHDVRHTGRNTTNAAPTADAGADQTVKSEDTVTLNGSNSSDPDYGIPLFKWTQTEGDTVTLNDDTSDTPTFSPPSVDEDKKNLTFQLKVTDNGGLTDTDTVQITVEKSDDDSGCFIGTIRN